MAKLTEKQAKEILTKVSDIKLSLSERKVAHSEILNLIMNPHDNFDPTTFDPMATVDNYEVKKRDRVEPPKRLPTMGMSPKKLFEGQMVGMYESKQDLYLLIAWLSNRVSDLEDKLPK